MVGSSPISAGDEPELRSLVTLMTDNATALDLVAGDDNAAERLKGLTSLRGEIGDAARSFCRMVGYRTIMSWEPMDEYILEKPALLTSKIRHGITGSYATVDEDFVQSVRDKVADANKAEFDELYNDARKYSCIRDERDIYCNMPISGLVRRAVLEAGKRIHKKGLIDEAEHMTEASPSELQNLLIKGDGPSATELGDRYTYRQRYTINDVPETLGAPDQQPINPDWLPGAARTFARMAMLQQIGIATTDSENEEIKGQKASGGSYEGIARVIHSADQLNRIQQGDVLITPSTNPAFNVVLPQLGAIVTAFGGVLSHAAIVAREFGIPAVVGCRKVTEKIKDGAIVRVDGDTGTVTVI